jgi:membrane fusion protein (multidrug efflux system)
MKANEFMKVFNVGFCIVLLTAGASLSGAPSEVIGITEPFEDVTLSSPVSGIVTVQALNEGDFVKAGGVILELDKKMEELELARRKVVAEAKGNDLENTRKLFKSTKGVSKEELEKKEMEYKLAAVEQEMAAEQLRRRVVSSPVSGIITEIYLDVGEACQPLTPLVKVVDTTRCFFVANVEPSVGTEFKIGQAVALQVQTGSGSLGVKGTISYLAPVVDAASGLQKLKAIFDNADGRIRPGVAARMSPQ